MLLKNLSRRSCFFHITNLGLHQMTGKLLSFAGDAIAGSSKLSIRYYP